MNSLLVRPMNGNCRLRPTGLTHGQAAQNDSKREFCDRLFRIMTDPDGPRTCALLSELSNLSEQEEDTDAETL